MEPVSVKTYHRGADALKFLLMPFVCFACFGLPGRVGFYIAQLSQFAPAAFFLLCGYFAAENEQTGNDRSGKLIGRSARRFLLLFVIYLACNIALFLWQGATFTALVKGLLRKRVLFNFFVLNVWPFEVGETIWFIQSLLYVRIGLLVLKKLELMRYYKVLMILGFLSMLLAGELAGVVRFRLLGYSHLPANWFTYAMPYMLLGRFVYEKRAKLLALQWPVWPAGFALGAGMTFGEFTLLSRLGFLDYVNNYTVYAVGFCVMALCACCGFLRWDDMHRNFLTAHGKSYSRRIYAMSQPVGLLLLVGLLAVSNGLYNLTRSLGGIVVYLVCLLLAFLYGVVTRQMKTQGGEMIWNMKRRNERHKRRKQAEQRRKNDEAEV